MRGRKQDYIVIIFAVLLITIIFILAYLSIQNQSTTPPATQSPTPTPVIDIIDEANTMPPVPYEANATRRLLEKLNKREPLSPADMQAKAKMLTNLPEGEGSGIIHESRTVRIDYTKTADQFQVEIITTDISQAKADANIWFRSQGMSQKGICDYPMVFYLNYDIAQQLKNSGIQFSPLANSC